MGKRSHTARRSAPAMFAVAVALAVSPPVSAWTRMASADSSGGFAPPTDATTVEPIAGPKMIGYAPQLVAPLRRAQLPEEAQRLTTEGLINLALQYVTEVAISIDEGHHMRERAQSDKDLIKVSCIQDKLAQLKAAKHAMDERLPLLSVTVGAAVIEEARLHFADILTVYQRATKMRAELGRCVGAELSSVQVTEVTVEEPPTTDGMDPARPEAGRWPGMTKPTDIERPPAASPYR